MFEFHWQRWSVSVICLLGASAYIDITFVSNEGGKILNYMLFKHHSVFFCSV